MTVKEGIREASRTKNATLAGRIADYLRFHKGLDYADQMDIVKGCGVSPQDWEELLYESERT